MNKISAVYKIVNTVTGGSYIGSSKDVMRRWASHKEPSRWENQPNNPMYKDFQKYGLDKFRFQILAPVMEEHLKDVEQEFIEMLHPTYNSMYARGWDVEKIRKSQIKYRQSGKRREYMKEYRKDYMKEYCQSEKYKESCRKSNKKYFNQLCLYNGEELTLSALRSRFSRAGIEHPTTEAKKYLRTIKQ